MGGTRIKYQGEEAGQGPRLSRPQRLPSPLRALGQPHWFRTPCFKGSPSPRDLQHRQGRGHEQRLWGETGLSVNPCSCLRGCLAWSKFPSFSEAQLPHL